MLTSRTLEWLHAVESLWRTAKLWQWPSNSHQNVTRKKVILLNQLKPSQLLRKCLNKDPYSTLAWLESHLSHIILVPPGVACLNPLLWCLTRTLLRSSSETEALTTNASSLQLPRTTLALSQPSWPQIQVLLLKHARRRSTTKICELKRSETKMSIRG